MKGTLFSADFIKDEDANLRLLELNTDTGFITNTLSNRFDFSSFISILQSNSITELVIVSKAFQAGFVTLLKNTIATDATFITTVTEQLEDHNTIYPTAVSDSSEKFILRLAYDESALFDSTYCKQRENVQKLFYDNSATGSIPEFYYSGSGYEVSTLRSNINDHSSLPDFVSKPKSEMHSPLNFYKITGTDSSSADRITHLINHGDINTNSHTIEKFHYNDSDINDNNKISGFRTIGIVYGSDIEYVNIAQWRVESFFDVPTVGETTYISADNTNFVQSYDDKHYYQLTSNWIRLTDGDGMYYSTNVLNPDNTSGPIELLQQNDVVKSIFINGLPDGDIGSMYADWSSSGITLPSGSYVTSSVVEDITELSNNKAYGIVGEIKISETDAMYSTVGKHYLVYSTGSNAISFKSQYEIVATDHFLLGASGSLIPITSNKVIVLETIETGSLYQLDVETTDTYFVSSSNEPFIVHNSPCFVAGTQIEMEEEGVTKKIENVVVGDRVWTWNHDIHELEVKEVLEVMVKENKDTVIYTLNNDEVLEATLDHPIFIKELGDYASYNPTLTLSDSGLEVKQIEVGQSFQHIDWSQNLEHNDDSEAIKSIEIGSKRIVYNLKSVEDNHNFYANGFLVHNRAAPPGCCFIAGTEITLSNGDSKNIEDIIVGDEVIGWEDGKRSNGVVSELKPTYLGNRSLHNINDFKITFTDEHPFLTEDGWKSIKPEAGTEYGILKVGDKINLNEEWVEIQTLSEIEGEEYTQPVYNFTVKDINSYIADGIIVHNK